MHRKVQNYIEKHQLITPDSKVIIGVSGGADSVALLHLIHSLSYQCVVAHCNFHLRMEESDRDELFVRNMASEFKIPYYSVDFDTTEYARTHKVSIEMAARDLRYNWFEKLRVQLNAQAVLVAHHADDNIETLLMNLVRGTGLRGMTGIPNRNGKIVRPLLCCSREEILNYLMKYDLEYVEDSTNALSDYTRNKFRNEILPLLEEVNPSVRQTLYKTIERFENIESLVNNSIADFIKNHVIEMQDSLKINIASLIEREHFALILFEILNPLGFNETTIDNICKSIGSTPGKIFYAPDRVLLIDREFLIVNYKNSNSNQEYIITNSDKAIAFPIEMSIDKFARTDNFVVSKNKEHVHIDADKLKFPLIIRRWRDGDSFMPFGMKNRKKLSDFFIDEKFSRFEKDNCWLLTSENEIVWIIGHRIDNRFRINEKTKDIIAFKIVCQ